MTIDIGTQGGAILISLGALFFSIYLPLRLESRREKRQDKRDLADSFRRITLIRTESSKQEFNEPATGAVALRRWTDGFWAEIGTPGSCLWRNRKALELVAKNYEWLDKLDGHLASSMRESTQVGVYGMTRTQCSQNFGELMKITTKRFTATEDKKSRRLSS